MQNDVEVSYFGLYDTAKMYEIHLTHVILSFGLPHTKFVRKDTFSWTQISGVFFVQYRNTLHEQMSQRSPLPHLQLPHHGIPARSRPHARAASSWRITRLWREIFQLCLPSGSHSRTPTRMARSVFVGKVTLVETVLVCLASFRTVWLFISTDVGACVSILAVVCERSKLYCLWTTMTFHSVL